MVLFFGLVALIAATLLSLRWRRLREFNVTPQAFDLGDGQRVLLLIRVSKHKRRYRQQIGIAGSRGLDLHAEPEDWLARVFKAIGVSRDLSCGDARLDQCLMLESDDPRSRYWLRHDSAARTGLEAVFDLGADALTAYDDRIWASFSGSLDQLDDSPQRHRAVAAVLQRMAASVPDTLARAHAEVHSRQTRALTLLAISTGLGIAAISMVLIEAASRFPQSVGATSMYTASVLGWLVFGVLLWRLAAGWIGDSARARVVLLELGTVGLCGFVVSGAVLVGQANVALSSAPLMQEEMRVERVYSQTSHRRRGRRSTSYYLELPALHEGQIPARSWRIDADLHAQLQAGDTVRVSTQEGFFGVYLLTQAPELVRRGGAR